MHKLAAGIIAGLFVVAVAAPAVAKTETIRGQIVDQSCYLKDTANNKGKDHKMPKGDTADCAVACAKAGRPMALLTEDGKVYEITGGLAADKNAKIIPHIAHTVEVTGDVTEIQLTTAPSKKITVNPGNLSGNGSLDASNLQEQIDWLVKYGLVKSRVEATKLIDTTFTDRAVQQIGRV